MKVAFFDTHRFERLSFDRANQHFGHEIMFFEPRLTPITAKLAAGFPAVCAFVNDNLGKSTLSILASEGVRLLALRSAGYNHVDLAEAERLGMRVTRVPAYSPHAVAEHAVALILTLNRKICRAHARVRDLNFSLDGLVGFDLFGKTVGVIGTGRIGVVFAKIMLGFGCRVLVNDVIPSQELIELGARYSTLEEIYSESDVISLHVPLTSSTRHLLGAEAFSRMKPGVMVINTGRGALVDTPCLVEALKTGKVGAAGLDVYEEEENVFFQDLSETVLQDDVLARLMTFPNVLITSHQAFLTQEALYNIAQTTLGSISDLSGECL